MYGGKLIAAALAVLVLGVMFGSVMTFLVLYSMGVVVL
jgi:hypothetical protein